MRRLGRIATFLGLVLALAARPAVAKFTWTGHVETDAAGLSSDDEKKRKDAVQALGNDDIRLALPYLLRALEDPEVTVRQAAAKALGQNGAVAAVPTMMEWLKEPDPKTRRIAAQVLGDIGGGDATSALTRTLGDADDGVRLDAVRALGKIGKHGNANVVVALIPRLEDPKTEVKRETIQQLQELGDKRAVIPLVALFGDNSPPAIRALAVKAVGRLGDKAAVPALIRLIGDPIDDVKNAAVEALGLLGAVDAIDSLVEQIGTGTDTFRNRVAYSLGQIAAASGAGKAGEDAMKKLVELLAAKNTRRAAHDGLQVAGRAAVPALVACLSGRVACDPTSAVELLAGLEGGAPDPRATAALAAELERGRVAMPLVLRALGATGDPDAIVPVLGALGNRDASVRVHAMEALRPLLGGDARAGDVLVQHLADDDLDVRVLAAEYLGTIQLASAVPKLVALAGPGNPTRLRRAAIDALGEIGRFEPGHARVKIEAKPLLDVLREGPTELHRSAATALSYIADPDAIAALLAQARDDRGPTRHEVVRALGSTLRDRPDAAARKLLRELARDASVKVAIAAIDGLAAARDPEDARALRDLVATSAAERRRAGARALGELHDPAAWDVLAPLLAIKDDRLVGDVAWALGELASAAPTDKHVAPMVERWLYVARYGGWAGAIDATGALARALNAADRSARDGLVAGNRRSALGQLAFHKSRLVRVNAANALAALGGEAEVKLLVGLVAGDPSPHVRVAAIRGLARVAAAAPKLADRVAIALKTAADADPDVSVKRAAAGALGDQRSAPPAPPARDRWTLFYIVEPSADDAPVREEPYFIATPDDLVWATYTDARGDIATEHIPDGAVRAWAWPGSRESEY